MLEEDRVEPVMVLTLAALNPSDVNLIRDLNVFEANSYLKARNNIIGHDEAKDLIEMVRRNLTDLNLCINEQSKKIPAPGYRDAFQREAKVEVNRCFLNFMSAVRQFVDHTETRLKRQYKESPQVFDALKKRLGEAFDYVFAYRLFYKLRNFSQHCGVPVGIVKIETKLAGGKGKIHKLHLMFDRDKLIKEGGDTWGKVKEDLLKMDKKFPVDTMASTLASGLEKIWEFVRGIERPYLEENVGIILRTVEPVPRPYITPAVIVVNRNKNGTTLEFLNPPVETMAWLGDRTFKEIL